MNQTLKVHPSSAALTAVVAFLAATIALLSLTMNPASAQDEPLRCSISSFQGSTTVGFNQPAQFGGQIIETRRNGRELGAIELNFGQRSVTIDSLQPGTSYYSIRGFGSPWTYCGSTQGPARQTPVVTDCSVNQISTTTARVRFSTSSNAGDANGVTIRRNGRIVKNTRDLSNITIPAMDGTNHVSVAAWNQAGTSAFRYCGSFIVGGDQVPMATSCSVDLIEFNSAFLMVDRPAVDGTAVQVHLWRNGVVINTFQHFLFTVEGTTVNPGNNHFSVSTGRIGDAPDRSRRVYCNNVRF